MVLFSIRMQRSTGTAVQRPWTGYNGLDLSPASGAYPTKLLAAQSHMLDKTGNAL